MTSLGYKHTQEAKTKISQSHKGRELTLFHKQKLRLSKIGKPLSIEHKRKIGESNKGHIVSETTKQKIINANIGRKQTLQARINMSNAQKGKLGKLASNWQGGLNPLNKSIRGLQEYLIWRSKIFERDNWTCQTCSKKYNFCEAHHIKRLSVIIRENNITNTKEAIECNELWDLSNGVTLCRECHNLTKGVYSNFI